MSADIRAEALYGGAVLRIVLNRPKANILSGAMIEAIREALDREVTRASKLLVFEGAGEHFSFGASVEEHRRDEAERMLRTFHGLFEHLGRLSIPTCAVVRGQCLGGGLELASWCSFVVASPEAKLGQPEIRLAVFPPLASLLLPWRAGGGRALELCVSGRAVGAEEAKRMGVVNEVAEDPEAWWRALFEERLAPSSAAALRFAERAVRGPLSRAMARELPELERLYLHELMSTHDANEGIAAFIERRAPRYRDE